MIVVRGAILRKKIETNEFFIVENYREIEKGLEGLHNTIDEVLKIKNDVTIKKAVVTLYNP